MDNLTHSLVGLMLSRAGLNRNPESGGKSFGVMMVLAANAPDSDAYPFFYDSLTYLEVHRGYTHGLGLVPVMALLPLAIVRLATRSRPTVWEWIACMIVILSHLLLDWTNVYGIRMLRPFSDRWLHLDITNVIDPFIWLILLLAVAAPALAGLVSSEIGSRRTRKPHRLWAWIALTALLGYEGVRWSYHESAVADLNSRLYMGAPAVRTYAFPQGLGFTSWRGVVEGESAFYELPVGSEPLNLDQAYVDFSANSDPDAPDPAIAAVRQTRAFQVLESFNQVPFWRLSRMEDLTSVLLLDLRFTSLRSRGGGGFTGAAVVNDRGEVRDTGFGFGRPLPPGSEP